MEVKKVLGLALALLLVVGGVFALNGNLQAWNKDENKNISGYLQIKGSDTIVNLAQILAEHYMTDRPKVAVAVTGGGSGTGIAAMINGQTDIANASRDIKDKEIKQAQQRGIEPVEFVIGMDGLSVILHEDNKVSDLTIDQIGAIYRGEITNWKEVGGEDRKIVLYGRQSNSGTFSFFQDFVLQGDYSQNMMRMNGNAQIVEAIKADKGAIGYVGVSYVKDENGEEVAGLDVLKVATDANAEAYSPLDQAAVKAGKYPLVRTLLQYTNGKPEGVIKDWLEFVLSDAGQEIVTAEGFFVVPDNYATQNAKNMK